MTIAPQLASRGGKALIWKCIEPVYDAAAPLHEALTHGLPHHML
jgi:hypothetical protein